MKEEIRQRFCQPRMAAATLRGYERYHQFMDKLKESNVDKYVDLPMIGEPQ